MGGFRELLGIAKALGSKGRAEGQSFMDYFSSVSRSSEATEQMAGVVSGAQNRWAGTSSPGDFLDRLLFRRHRATSPELRRQIETEGVHYSPEMQGYSEASILRQELSGDQYDTVGKGLSYLADLSEGSRNTLEKEAFGAARKSAGAAVLSKARQAYSAADEGSRPFWGIPNFIINHPKPFLALGAAGMVVGPMDTVAGYMHGGPGYGGYIGFGEGNLGGRANIFQGASVNMNFEAQTMGLNELSSNQILPQGSMGTAPMMARRMGKQFQNSAQGLTLGLHKGRRGGY